MCLSKKLLFCFLLCFPLVAAKAQYHFDQWTTDNGLPQNSVRRIVQTSDGYIWFTTLDGLVRFDGVRFTVFNKSNSKNLLSNRFTHIFADSDDTLWISSEEEGVARYRNGEFQSFTTAAGLPSNSVFEMRMKPDGNLYARTSAGLARFDGSRFISVASIKELHQSESLYAPSGTFWEINENSLSVIRNGQKSVFDLPAELKNEVSPADDLVLSVNLFEDRAGVLWISTNSLKLEFLGGKLFKFANDKFEEISAGGMPPSLVNDIAQDPQGNLWLCTESNGVCRLTQNEFTCYDTENGLATNNINAFLTDREGTFWIVTEDKGIYRVTEQFITAVSTKQGLAGKNVYPILEDQSGAVWLGSLGSLARYKNGKLANYNKNDGLTFMEILSIFEDTDRRLWIGTYNGIQYLENGKFYDISEKFFPNIEAQAVTDIHRDRTGILWFASSLGLIRYDGKSVKTLTTEDGLTENNIKLMIENPDGSFWIGTYNGIALMKDEKFTAYSEKDGLAGNHVRSLYTDETGTLWIGTYESGLSRFKDGKFTNFTVENGLSSNGVFQILEDDRKNFWISSNQGIYRVSREQLNEFADGQRQFVNSTLFGKSDGMLTTEANGGGQPAGIKVSDGRLWFPTQDGVAVINPEAVKFNELPPTVVIENARIDNRKISGLQNGIKMFPGQENLEIDYTGLSFIKSEQVRFRYRLEGLNEKWTEAGNRRTAFFPRLAPGEYVFQVIAANSDNVWNEQGSKITISVKPPFYQHFWFIALIVVLAVGMVFALVKRRIWQLEKEHTVQQAFSRQLIASQEQER